MLNTQLAETQQIYRKKATQTPNMAPNISGNIRPNSTPNIGKTMKNGKC